MSNTSLFEDLRNEVESTSTDCKFYQNLCNEVDYNVDQSITDSNLEEIPYINCSFFKESNERFTELLRIPFKELAYWTISSSTSGDPSIVGRGPEDIEIFKNNYEGVFEEFSQMSSMKKLILLAPHFKFLNRMPGEWKGKRGYLFYRDIVDIWRDFDITYLLKFKVLKVLFHLITRFHFKAFIEIDGKLMNKSFKSVEKERMPTLVANSAPLMHKNFSDYKKKHKSGFDMPPSFRIQTGGGGWSGKKGQVKLDYEINKVEFIDTLSEFFNITHENFADLYGATEIPIACGGHWSKKHEDFLLHAKKDSKIIIRSLEDLERIKKNKEPGIIEVLSPYGVKAYAGVAVLLDDIIEIVDFHKCIECGREGPVFKVIGKLTPEIGKGCSSFTNLFPFENK